MHQGDILIIGGGPAGMVAAATCKQYYPDKKVTVLKKDETSLVPCGIPYVFGPMLQGVEDDLIPCGAKAEKIGVELIIDAVVSLDFETRCAIGNGGVHYGYEKLILATGSVPNRPKQIANHDAPGVFYVAKNPEYIMKMHASLAAVQSIAVVGTGFIGIEVAGELARAGKKVHLVGSRLLKHAFDAEFSEQMEAIMLHENVTFYKDRRSCEVLLDAEGHACGLRLEDAEQIACEAVVMATGYRPENSLARKAGLSMRQFDTIYVDEYMRTTQPDVFAVGDCAEKRHFITKRTLPIMLASTATAEARIAAANLYAITIVKSFSGTIDIFSTVIGGTCFAAAGITEEDAKKQQISVISSSVISDDKHPAKLPNNHRQTVKLVVMKSSFQVIGAQVIGGIDIGEMINILGVIIEKRMNVFDLLNLQVATHPLLTSSPTTYPIIQAAQNIAMMRFQQA